MTDELDPVVTESALVAIGLPAILDAAPKWGVAVQHEAAQLPRKIKQAINGFLTQGERKAVDNLPDFDYQKTRALLDELEGNAQQVADALFAAVDDPELGHAIAETATRIAHELTAKMPRKVRSTITGDIPERPSDMEVARFARIWQVAVDPLIVLRDLNEHSLSGDQVDALEALWPALYGLVKESVVKNLIAIKGDRPKWELDGRRDSLLRDLMKAPKHDAALASDFQTTFAAVQAEKAAAPATGGLNPPPDLQTPGQKPPGALQPR